MVNASKIRYSLGGIGPCMCLFTEEVVDPLSVPCGLNVYYYDEVSGDAGELRRSSSANTVGTLILKDTIVFKKDSIPCYCSCAHVPPALRISWLLEEGRPNAVSYCADPIFAEPVSNGMSKSLCLIPVIEECLALEEEFPMHKCFDTRFNSYIVHAGSLLPKSSIQRGQKKMIELLTQQPRLNGSAFWDILEAVTEDKEFVKGVRAKVLAENAKKVAEWVEAERAPIISSIESGSFEYVVEYLLEFGIGEFPLHAVGGKLEDILAMRFAQYLHLNYLLGCLGLPVICLTRHQFEFIVLAYWHLEYAAQDIALAHTIYAELQLRIACMKCSGVEEDFWDRPDGERSQFYSDAEACVVYETTEDFKDELEELIRQCNEKASEVHVF